MKELPDYTWKELAEQFKELRKVNDDGVIHYTLLDDNPSNIKINGTSSRAVHRSFLNLCEIAGEKAKKLMRDEFQFGYRDTESDFRRWLLLLAGKSDSYSLGHWYIKHLGDRDIKFQDAKIKQPIGASERLCMKLTKYDNIPKKMYKKIWINDIKPIWRQVVASIIAIIIAIWLGLN